MVCQGEWTVHCRRELWKVSDRPGRVGDRAVHSAGRALAGPLRILLHRAGSVTGLLGKCRMLAVSSTVW